VKIKLIPAPIIAVIGSLVAASCGGEDQESKSCSIADPVRSCDHAQVCEEVAGAPTCVAPLVVRGRVTEPGGLPIAAAVVTALDANDAPTTGTAFTDADGRYELRVATPRDASGKLPARAIKLRASASGFETFPSGLRRSLPLEVSAAAPVEGKVVFAGDATTVVLWPIPNPAALGTIAGSVQGEPGKRGVLVVAEGPAALSAVSDADGTYVVFNAPPGAYTVRGFAAGVQLAPATVSVTAGARAAAPDLVPMATPLGSVAGSVEMVDAPGGSMTSVVLVVASTFNEALARGEGPPGLRAPRSGMPSVSGPFTITDVPDGRYVVLAAFENDGLVRDPDTAIGGTQIQRIEVGPASRQVSLASGFKVTGGLAVVRPGAGDSPEPIAGPPTFVWKDDASEDHYALEVVDNHGTVVWRNDNVPRANGGEVSIPYAGPALAKGPLYQFRVTSFRRGTVPISQTEDLRGPVQAASAKLGVRASPAGTRARRRRAA
jgi:hypothetical protein